MEKIAQEKKRNYSHYMFFNDQRSKINVSWFFFYFFYFILVLNIGF